MSKYNRVRLTPEERRQQIVNAALEDAIERGPYNISVISVSRRLSNCTKSTIRHYFSTVTSLRDAVIIEAVETSCQTVIGAAVAMKHSLFEEHDQPVSQEEKQKCLQLYLDQG